MQQTEAHEHHAFPSTLAFLLNNPLRRTLSPPSKILDKLGIRPTDVVVDFGCGPGFYAAEIARRAGTLPRMQKTVTIPVSVAPDAVCSSTRIKAWPPTKLGGKPGEGPNDWKLKSRIKLQTRRGRWGRRRIGQRVRR